METKWLEDFVSLAETRSFSRSAQLRHVTQPAFSRHIRSLEEWVGVDLVDRGAHPAELTDAGRKFLPLAREERYLHEIRSGLRPGALVVVRGHMRVPRPDIAGYCEVTERFDELIRAERTQLWHIHAYEYES